MVRFFLNDNLFNNPRDWSGFSTEFKRDYDKRIISVQYSDTITFSGAAHSYIKSVDDADGYCAKIDLRVEEQCQGGQWRVLARGTVIMADCEWNEKACTVQCSVADNGIGARVANNKNVPVSPLSDLSKNSVSIGAVSPTSLTMFQSADGTDITGVRRTFDWFECLKQALAYITDGEVSMTSTWYTSLPDNERYALAIGAELRTSGVTVPRIAWTFDDLFNELSKKYNLWIFATEDAFGDPLLVLETEDYFITAETGPGIFNIADLIRKVDTKRLYATVDVGSDKAITELLTANPLPFVVLLGFTKETFHFKGVCNTDASLDLVNQWIIDTDVIYQIVEQDNDEYDEDVVIIQYDRSTNKATQGQYLFQGTAPYLYNEQLLNSNVIPRFRLPSEVGSNYSPGVDDRFLAVHDFVGNRPANWEVLNLFNFAQPTVQIGLGNDFVFPAFDTNNVWGNGTTPGLPVSTVNSRFTPTAQGVFVLDVQFKWEILTTYPVANDLNTYSIYIGVGFIVSAYVYNSLNVLLSTTVIGTTVERYTIGTYLDPFTFTVSLSVGDYVTFYAQGYKGGTKYNTELGAPVEPIPNPQPGFNRTAFNFAYGMNIGTDTIVNGFIAIPTSPSLTSTFTFDRFLSSDEWLSVIHNPGAALIIDGDRSVYPSVVNRKITGETSFELIKQP